MIATMDNWYDSTACDHEHGTGDVCEYCCSGTNYTIYPCDCKVDTPEPEKLDVIYEYKNFVNFAPNPILAPFLKRKSINRGRHWDRKFNPK